MGVKRPTYEQPEEMVEKFREEVQKRTQADEALKASETRYRRLFETAQDGILILNADTGEVVDVNPFLIKLLGYSHEEFMGKKLWEIGSFKDREESKSAFQELQKKGYVRYDDLPLKTNDGQLISVEFVSNVYSVNDKKVIQCNIRNITERKQVEKLLTKSEEDLRILSSQLITAQEDERQRIAMELHDDISSKLAGIKFSLEKNLIHPPEAIDQRNKLSKDVIDTVKDVMTSIRRIMSNLRPSLIDDLGLLPTINWYCREFPKTHDAATIEKELDINEEDIPEDLKIVIFRVIQEALNNIAKHSQADQVRLSLKRIEGTLELLVEDNGQGFDVEKRNTDPGEYKGFGLTGMKVRIRHSGGTFSIESLKGKGTVIRATWPMRLNLEFIQK